MSFLVGYHFGCPLGLGRVLPLFWNSTVILSMVKLNVKYWCGKWLMRSQYGADVVATSTVIWESNRCVRNIGKVNFLKGVELPADVVVSPRWQRDVLTFLRWQCGTRCNGGRELTDPVWPWQKALQPNAILGKWWLDPSWPWTEGCFYLLLIGADVATSSICQINILS